MSMRSGAVMTAAAIVAYYERIKMPIPPEVAKVIGADKMAIPAVNFADQIKKLRQPKQPNKTEAEFKLIQEAKGIYSSVQFEAIRLRLADGLTYTPDLFCRCINHAPPCIYEVKGAWIDGDAIPKFKMAREVWGWLFQFEMHQKLNGTWNRIF